MPESEYYFRTSPTFRTDASLADRGGVYGSRP